MGFIVSAIHQNKLDVLHLILTRFQPGDYGLI